MRSVCLSMIGVVWVVSPWAFATEGPAGQGFPDKEILVGVNYFAGWWEPLPNKWHGHGWTVHEPDWRCENPQRDPLLGIYNDQATMDREIVAAAGYGVDFFAILWYFPAPESKHREDCKWLNRGVENFQRSPEARRMRFFVEYCNHDLSAARTDAEWEQCLATWLAAMRHPSYLRVGGRLVFKVHDSSGFFRQNGQDVECCRARLKRLRAAAREAGLGEILIGGGLMARSEVKPGSAVARLYDFTATYMSLPAVEVTDAEQPYGLLAQESCEARARHTVDPIPWVPYLAAGWNPRPWTHPKADENHRRFFAFPTRDQWADELRRMRDDLGRCPGLGLPLADGRRQKVFTIYAWNEFGEGGIVAPTRADRYMKLDAVREVFGGNGDPPSGR